MLSNRRGITLVEILLFSSISIGLSFWLVPWLSKPSRIQQKMQATLEQQKALRATDIFVNDIKQTLPGQLTFDPAGQSLTLEIAGESPLQVRYIYQASPGPQDGLYRIANGSSTVLLSGLVTSASSAPLFRYDSELRILTLDVLLKMVSGPPLRVVRRVALAN